MHEFGDHYEEEYLYLADLTDTAVLISWGKYFFASTMELVRDRKLHLLDGQHGRHTSIGANCEPFGPVDVEVLNAAGTIVQSIRVVNDTFAWVSGLTPDTEYTYRVIAEPETTRRVWAAGQLWSYSPRIKELVETDRTYACRFRTFPPLDSSAPLTFAVIGDTGTGDDEQARLARALEAAVDRMGARFVLMTGDTVYRGSGGAGDDDDEWLMTYFQPYRTLIDRIPFYPCVGNHDTAETLGEGQGDTLMLYDNLLVTPRFSEQRPGRHAEITKGLFYRFRYGADVEFICLDTSKEKLLFGKRMFQKDPGRTWMRQAFTQPLGSPRWRIAFSHHPPYAAGPLHGDTNSMRDDIVPLCIDNGVRAFFSGHEHNFQCLDSEDPRRRVRCFVTGGGGTWREGEPNNATNGFMQAWGGNAGTHFLMVTIDGSTMRVEPTMVDGDPLPLVSRRGQSVESPLVVTL